MNKSDIIEKIKKLLEINRSNGATEAEEAAAMERENVLMTKYQIEEFQLQGSIKSKNTEKEETLTDSSFSFSQFRCAVAEFFGVLSLYSSTTYSFYGASDNVDLALTMVKRGAASLSLGYTDYICSDEYRKNRRNASRLDVRKSFADGFYIKIAKRLEDLVDQRKAETKKATGTDLVVLNTENLENQFNEDFNTTLKTGRARRPRNFDPASFVAGTKKGKEFRILDEVEHENN